VAVPHRLEDAVGEAEDEDVLDRLLAEVVIDPIDLLLREDAGDLAVERPRALQVAAERLLDDDAGPAALHAGEAGSAEVGDDVVIEARWRRAIEEPVARAAAPALDLLEPLLEAAVQLRAGRVTGDVVHAAREPVPHVLRGNLEPREARHAFARAPAVRRVGHLAARGADDGEELGQRAGRVEAPQRGYELAVRQVARRAEDDERERLIGVRHGHRTGCGARRAAGPRTNCRAASGSVRRARR